MSAMLARMGSGLSNIVLRSTLKPSQLARVKFGHGWHGANMGCVERVRMTGRWSLVVMGPCAMWVL